MPEQPPPDDYPGGLPAWLQSHTQEAPAVPAGPSGSLAPERPEPPDDGPPRPSRGAIWMALAAALLVGAIAGAALTLIGGGGDDDSASSSGGGDSSSEVVNLEQRLKQAERREDEAREDLQETEDELAETKEQLEEAEQRGQTQPNQSGGGNQGGGNQGGRRVQRFSGTGPRQLGNLQIPADSILRWTNRGGGLFAMTTGAGPKTTILSSNQQTGETELPAGTYTGARVLSAARWTIEIRPR
jgi:hypothetical protein